MIAKIIPVVRTLFEPHGASALFYEKWPRGKWAYSPFVGWVRLSLDYPVAPKVTRYGCDLAAGGCGGSKANTLAELEAMIRSDYFDPDTKKLHLKLVSTNTDYEELKVDPSSP